MNNLRFPAVFLALCLVLLRVSTASAQTSEEKALQEEYNRTYKRIDALGASKDLQGLVKLADEISSGSLKSRNMVYYGELTGRICQVIVSECAGDPTHVDKMRYIAARALQTYDPAKKDNISVETQYSLLCGVQEQLVYSKGTMSDEEWLADRRAKAGRWFQLWDRMQAAIDPNWNENELIFAKVRPPAGARSARGMVFSGMLPESITDPVLRGQYKKEVEENNKKKKQYTEQRNLRLLKRRFTRSLISYFGSTYAIPPYNDSELESLLAQHVKDEQVKKAILEAVDKRKRGVE